jgi:hypothetical protein
MPTGTSTIFGAVQVIFAVSSLVRSLHVSAQPRS